MNLKKLTALALSGILLTQAGCAGGNRELTREELTRPEPARAWEVTTVGGERYTFVALHLEGNRLLGTARFTETARVGEGDEARETISNRYEELSIPWEEVARVEAVRDRELATGGFLLAAASVAVGIAAFLLFTQDSTDPPTGGGGGGK